ncbi:phosphatase PAP2 family protein, partial [Paraburkholderia sp. SIMBA_027]|uniref:phosphatase PAP2 family protein n=1 Tax=Paraburkholderia sp. SIMBA_027 TaxID=3085770 RepID=UPI00397845BE
LLFPRFRLVFIGIGLWLGATRVIIGVHYPSDVAAGLALGAWLAFALSIAFARFGFVFSVGREGWPIPRLSRLI